MKEERGRREDGEEGDKKEMIFTFAECFQLLTPGNVIVAAVGFQYPSAHQSIFPMDWLVRSLTCRIDELRDFDRTEGLLLGMALEIAQGLVE